MNGIEIKNLPLLTSISGNEDLMISTQEGKARRIKTNLVTGNITTLKLNSMSEMNRVDLSDGIYNIDGAISGALIIVNSHNNNVPESVLQTYIDSADIYTREITISANQVYPTWKVKSVTLGSVYGSDMFNIVDTNGFINGTIWTDVYKFLLIPGSYGVYFTTPPIPLLEPTQKNFTLTVDYASYKSSGSLANSDITHILINPENGKSYIRKVYHTSNGITCNQFSAIGPSSAVVTPTQGINGTDTEFIYKLNSTASGVYAPSGSNTDVFIPSGWSANLDSVNSSLPFAFMSKRKRDKFNNWGAFSAPAIIAHYAKDGINGINGITGHDGYDGKDGPGVEFIFRRTPTYSAPDRPTVSTNVDDYVPFGWTDDPTGVDGTYQYEWICKRKKSIQSGQSVATWGDFSQPALWAKYTLAGSEPGIPGEPGKDGKDIQFVYKLTNSTNQIDPPVSPLGDIFQDGNGWYNDMLSVSGTNRYLWCSRRYKAASVWSEFTQPVIWAVWSLDGRPGADGKSFEYIFSRTQTISKPQIKEEDRLRPNTDDFVPSDYNGSHWTDDPTGVDPTWIYEWISHRKKTNGLWDSFSEPALWTKYSKDGNGGINAVHANLSREIVNISCMADGSPRTTQLPTDVYISTFDGSTLSAATIVAAPDINTTKCTVTPFSTGVYKLTITELQAANDVIRLSIKIMSSQLGTEVELTKVINIFKTKDGYAGPMIIARGAYQDNTTYYGNPYRVDAVSISNEGATQWYITRTTAGEITGVLPTDEGSGKWDVMPSFEMIATGMLLAENANIAEFTFNRGRLKSQYPSPGMPTNLNGGQNLELDGVNGVIELNTVVGDIKINNNGIFLNDENGLNAVSIYNGDIPELNEDGEFALSDEEITNVPSTSLGSGSFIGTKDINVPNTSFSSHNNINKIEFHIPSNINITQQIGSLVAIWMIYNTDTNSVYKSYTKNEYQLGSTIKNIDFNASFYNVPSGNYSIKLRLVHPYSSPMQYSYLDILPTAKITYQDISLGTVIGNDGIAFATAAKEYVVIKRGSDGKTNINISGNVNIISENGGEIHIGSTNSYVNLEGHVKLNGVDIQTVNNN